MLCGTTGKDASLLWQPRPACLYHGRGAYGDHREGRVCGCVGVWVCVWLSRGSAGEMAVGKDVT